MINYKIPVIATIHQIIKYCDIRLKSGILLWVIYDLIFDIPQLNTILDEVFFALIGFSTNTRIIDITPHGITYVYNSFLFIESILSAEDFINSCFILNLLQINSITEILSSTRDL